MSAPVWVHELASSFWREAGEEELFPRNLRRPVARALPITVVSLPRLRVASVDGWLLAQGIPDGVQATDRPLCACLVAYHGHGVVFLDGTDPDDEQRFSLAHEVAHFLRDYRAPRRRATEAFGDSVLQVFDGERPPLPAERVHALVAGVPVGVHVHLMERGEGGAVLDERVDAAEAGADRLAFQLLAPEEAVLADLGGAPADPVALARLLVEHYGLPRRAATRYAGLLAPREREPSPFLKSLRLVR